MSHVFKIVPKTQKYAWGKIGVESKVAQYAAAAKIPGFTLDEKVPYAEVCSRALSRSCGLTADAAMDGNPSKWSLLCCGD